MKSLIVDDDMVSRIKLGKILSSYGECVVVENGEAGLLAFIQARRENAPFDLVCLDVSMPGKDGTEVLFEMREIEQKLKLGPGQTARILMTTAHRDKDTVITSIQAGCDGYLVKPFDRHKILSKFNQLGIKV